MFCLIYRVSKIFTFQHQFFKIIFAFFDRRKLLQILWRCMMKITIRNEWYFKARLLRTLHKWINIRDFNLKSCGPRKNMKCEKGSVVTKILRTAGIEDGRWDDNLLRTAGISRISREGIPSRRYLKGKGTRAIVFVSEKPWKPCTATPPRVLDRTAFKLANVDLRSLSFFRQHANPWAVWGL